MVIFRFATNREFPRSGFHAPLVNKDISCCKVAMYNRWDSGMHVHEGGGNVGKNRHFQLEREIFLGFDDVLQAIAQKLHTSTGILELGRKHTPKNCTM